MKNEQNDHVAQIKSNDLWMTQEMPAMRDERKMQINP